MKCAVVGLEALPLQMTYQAELLLLHTSSCQKLPIDLCAVGSTVLQTPFSFVSFTPISAGVAVSVASCSLYFYEVEHIVHTLIYSTLSVKLTDPKYSLNARFQQHGDYLIHMLSSSIGIHGVHCTWFHISLRMGGP